MTRKSNAYLAALREAQTRRPNFVRVRRLLDRALAGGSPDAAYALGTWYLFGHHVPQNERRAFRLLRDAAEARVADALLYVAICHEKGVGTKTSLGRAFEYYVLAALHGESSALFEVGRCLYYGIGVAKSRRLAWLWLDRAKELGVIDDSKTKQASSSRRVRGRPRKSPGKPKARTESSPTLTRVSPFSGVRR